MSTTFLTPQQMADRYQLTVKALYSKRYTGKLPPAIKVGGSLRWRLADVEKWETQQIGRVA